MDTFQIERMFSRRVRCSLKNIPSPNDELTFHQLKLYYQGVGKELNEQFLRNLNLLTSDGKLNYAAFWVADVNSILFLVARYQSIGRAELTENENYGYCSLIRIYDRLQDKLMAENRTFAKITLPRRLERKMIAPEPLREAVLNALLHNDYLNGGTPKIEFFSDRVEITSSGGLPYGMSQEEFFSGASNPRNPELMRIFRDLDIVEHLGSGVPRILKEYPKSVFRITDNFINVTLPYAEGFLEAMKESVNDTVSELDDTVNDTVNQLLMLIKNNPKITYQEMCEKMGKSRTTISRYIQALRQSGKITRIGSDKSGHWELNQK